MANDKRMDCVILGYLMHGPMSGYDIKKSIDLSINHFWGGSYGSIYPTLAKLLEGGQIVKVSEDLTGRERTVYEITELGKEVLHDWIRTPATKDELRYETLVKIFFGGPFDMEETIAHIKRFEREHSDKLERLNRIEADVKAAALANKEDVPQYLALLIGKKTYEGHLQWCKEALEFIEKHK